MGILVWIIIGLVAGWLANQILGGPRRACCTISRSAWSAPSSAG